MVNIARLYLIGVACVLPLFGNAQPVDGIRDLANRLLQGHGDDFDFYLTTNHTRASRWNPPSNDNYTVTASGNGRIRVEGTTLSALARGYVSLDNLCFHYRH